MSHLFDLPRVFAAFLCSGIFWMMVLFLTEKHRPWRGSGVIAAVILVVSAYLFLAAVAHGPSPALPAVP